MNYEHNDEFEQMPDRSQRNGGPREPGRGPGRVPAGNGRPEEGGGGRPVRREGGGPLEGSRQPQGRGVGGNKAASAGGAPGSRRTAEEAPGRQPGRPSGTGRIPQGPGRIPQESGGAGRQTGSVPGTGRIPQEASGRQPGRLSGTGRIPQGTGRISQESGGAGRQPGRVPGPGRIPQESGGADRQPGRVPGTGRIPGEAGLGGDQRRQEGRAGAGAGRRPGAAGQPEEELSVIRAGRTSGAGRTASRETASAREADLRKGTAGSGRSQRTGGAGGLGESPRETLAQAKIQKAKKRRRTRRLIAMIVAECLMLTVIFTYAYFARHLNMIQREDFNKEDVKNSELSLDDLTKMKGYWMVAVFGVDSRSNSVGAGNQADVNMICCINQDTGEIKLVSVYRDTYLNINDSNSYRKINAAYSNGGPEQALKALNKNLDLNITDYVTFSWKAVAEGINILGGVDVEITRPEFRYINAFITETVEATGIGSHHLPQPGFQHLDGVQAVAYGRLRLMDTDYARTERQRKIIELAFAKAKQSEYSVLNNILVTTLPSVSTNLDFVELTNLALSISKYYIGETAGFPFAKGNANMPGKGDCVIPQTLESNVSQLHTFLFGDESYTPTDQVKQISSKIAADSGMHREGKPSTGSALATDSYVPEESTTQRTTEAESPEETSESEESSEPQTDESGNLILHPNETDENGNLILYPSETDENGNLIDAPIDDWPEEDPLYPGGQNNNQTGNGPEGPGTSTRPGGTQGQNPGRPTDPSESSGGREPGESTSPGSESQPGTSRPSGGNTGSRTPEETEGPGGAAGPGGSSPAGTTPSGTTSPGSTSPGSTSPGDTSPGGSGNSGSGGSGDGAGGPGSSQQPSGGQTPGQPSQGGRTSSQSPDQTDSPQTSGGQTSNPQSPADQSSGQPADGGGPGTQQRPGL